MKNKKSLTNDSQHPTLESKGSFDYFLENSWDSDKKLKFSSQLQNFV